jgi:hypothetical protein
MIDIIVATMSNGYKCQKCWFHAKHCIKSQYFVNLRLYSLVFIADAYPKQLSFRSADWLRGGAKFKIDQSAHLILKATKGATKVTAKHGSAHSL